MSKEWKEDLCEQYREMIKTSEEHIERLLRLKDQGATLGSPGIEEAIAREHESIERLQLNMARMGCS